MKWLVCLIWVSIPIWLWHDATQSKVYACSDKTDHTPEITKLCKQLTRWHHWNTGAK